MAKATKKKAPAAAQQQREKAKSAADLALLQAENPLDDVGYLASHLRQEFAGWTNPKPVDDVVTVKMTHGVTVSYSISAAVRAFVAEYKADFDEWAAIEGDAFMAGVESRHPDADSQRVLSVLTAAASSLHGREAVRAFHGLLPRFMKLAMALTARAANTHARLAGKTYELRDIATGESLGFEFPPETQSEYRDMIAEDAERETREILRDLWLKRGRDSVLERNVAAYMRRDELVRERVESGMTEGRAFRAAKEQVQLEYPDLAGEASYSKAMSLGGKEALRRSLILATRTGLTKV